MTLPICKLCKSKEADKKNSHIIPKFLSKGLFEFAPHRHSVFIGKEGKIEKPQDTPKEDNILCSICEKKIEILETYFARVIKDIHSFKEFTSKFRFINEVNNTKFIECLKINPTLFKLFIYSLIWRASISNLREYLKYNVPLTIEEEVRNFLNTNLNISQNTLFDSLEKITEIPNYHICVIKPIDKSRGIFTAYNLDESRHLLLIVDFAIFFFSDDKSIDKILKSVSNKQNEKVIIGLGETKSWNDLNQNILELILYQN